MAEVTKKRLIDAGFRWVDGSESDDEPPVAIIEVTDWIQLHLVPYAEGRDWSASLLTRNSRAFASGDLICTVRSEDDLLNVLEVLGLL